VAEQSHKREMSEAVRGDFERLRRRLEGAERKEASAQERSPELVLTPPGAAEPVPEAAHESEETGQPETETPFSGEAAAEGAPEVGRSRLRSIFRRG
jgi:hypothetical protein